MAGSETLTWRTSYRQIRNGENVESAVANRPPDDLWNNLLYLKNLVDNLTTGKSLILTEQRILVGTDLASPVYLASNGLWYPALAELSSAPNSTLYQLTSKAYVGGLVLQKSDTASGFISGGIYYTTGTVIIQGEAVFGDEFADVIAGDYIDGIQYLSPFYAGQMTSLRTVAPVRVCLSSLQDDGYHVIVNPDQRALLESHGHYHVVLADQPAGGVNCVPTKFAFMWGEMEPEGPYPGITHTIVSPNTDAIGWLPADSPAFDGMDIPEGAKFGYNIPADESLAPLWPPMPIDQVYVEVDGVGEVGDLVIVNNDGIWWMDDNYGKAPWSVNYPCESSASAESSPSSEAPYPDWPVRIEVWFTKVIHGTTLMALSNHIDLEIGALPDLTPLEVGSNIESGTFSETAMRYLRFFASGSSSSSSSAAGANDVIYRASARDFSTPAGRRSMLRFELVLSGSPTLTAATILDIVGGFTMTLSRMSRPTTGLTKLLSEVATSELAFDWSTGPADVTAIPTNTYFMIRSEEIELSAEEVLFLKLSWDGTVLTALDDEVYLYAVRPTITVP